MQTLRQLGGGVIIAIISVILVIGGISLALAETLPAAGNAHPDPAHHLAGASQRHLYNHRLS